MIKIEIDENKGKSSIEAIGSGLEIAAELICAVFDIAEGIGDDGTLRKLLSAAFSDEELFAQILDVVKEETDDD